MASKEIETLRKELEDYRFVGILGGNTGETMERYIALMHFGLLPTYFWFLYVIRYTNDPYKYWNNETGWVFKQYADIYDIAEKDQVSLPFKGEWVRAYPISTKGWPK